MSEFICNSNDENENGKKINSASKLMLCECVT